MKGNQKEQLPSWVVEDAIERFRTAAVRVSESSLLNVDARRRIESDARQALLDLYRKQQDGQLQP